MKKLLFCFTALLFFTLATAQKETNNWALDNYQLDFNGDQPQVKFEFSQHLNRGMGIISDSNGSLLFYTDGFSIWNMNHKLMPNGSNVIPTHSNTSTQESIIIQKPGTESRYYIFTVDPWNGQETSGLYYSEVDLGLDGGLGDVITKGIQLMDSTTNKLSATFHKNGEDVWLLTHKHNTNYYYSFLITSKGISAPIEHKIGQKTSFWFSQMKFSTDGHKVGTTHDIFDFNNETGALSNCVDLDWCS